MKLRHLCSLVDLILSLCQVAVADVVLDGVVEEDAVLRDDGDIGAQPLNVVLTNVLTSDPHRPGGGLVKPVQ